MCFYRIVELSAGRITIDGRDIAHVPLRVLRARLSIIPQDPVLFTGSLRHNLDPFDERSDAQLRTALERCGILAMCDGHAERLQARLGLELGLGLG